MIRTVATPVNTLVGPTTHRHVRSRWLHHKMDGRLYLSASAQRLDQAPKPQLHLVARPALVSLGVVRNNHFDVRVVVKQCRRASHRGTVMIGATYGRAI